MSDIQSILPALKTPFKATEVKKRSQGGRELHYVPINATINRVLDVTEGGYTFTVVEKTITPIEWRSKQQFLAEVHGRLSIGHNWWDGLGADISDDPDKALKTAQAEAYKKAGHQIGIGLELWEEEARQQVDEGQRAAAGDTQSLKNQVSKLAKTQGAEMTAKGIAKHFKITQEQLKEEAVLTKILRDNNIID